MLAFITQAQSFNPKTLHSTIYVSLTVEIVSTLQVPINHMSINFMSWLVCKTKQKPFRIKAIFSRDSLENYINTKENMLPFH